MRIKIDTNETDQFNGLFTHLFSSRSENYIRNNILKVTASSIYPDRGDPFDTINPFVNITKFQDYWISQSKERSNITISFLQHHFALNSYSLRGRRLIYYNCPLEWVLEGTNDFHHWVTIHWKERGNELKGDGKEYHMNCSRKEFFSTYRFTMIGENYHISSNEKYIFGLETIEFFGALSDSLCTIPNRHFANPFLMFFLFSIHIFK